MTLELLRLDRISPDSWLFFRSVLTPDELKRAARYRQEQDRRAFIAGRGIVRQRIAAIANAAPLDVKLYTGPTGKPFVKGMERKVQFNISHCRGLLAIAISTSGVAVGVDVEQVRPHFEYGSICRHYFSKAERAEVQSPEDFFQLWTMKEAFLKATGTALVDGLANLDFSSSQRNVPLFASALADWQGQAFVVHSYTGTDWVLSVAHPDTEVAITFVEDCIYRQKKVQLDNG